MCFATMYLVMLVCDDVLYWIPGYHSMMLSFVCYLMSPVFNGAKSVRKSQVAAPSIIAPST